MNFPVFSVVKFVESDGFLTPAMQDYNDLLAQALEAGLSDNGWTVPQISATDLVAIEPQMPDGTIWYEITNNVFVGKENGSLVKFTTTPYP